MPVRTLDEVLDETGVDRVRLLKLDCEGAERFVIPGAERRLRLQAVDVLALEYHPAIIGPAAIAEIHRRLLGWGYEFVDNRGQTVYATAAGASAVRAWSRAGVAATPHA